MNRSSDEPIQTPRKRRLAILLSGRGSNFEAIAKNVASGEIPNARIVIVISNRADAGGRGAAALAALSAGRAKMPGNSQHGGREHISALGLAVMHFGR